MTRPNAEPPPRPGVLGAPAAAPEPPQGQTSAATVAGAHARTAAGPAAAPAQPQTGRPATDRATAPQTLAGVAAEADTEASAMTQPVAGLIASAPMPPAGPPPNGTLYGPRTDDDRRSAPSGRQPSLRIGWHTASASALTTMGVSPAATGLILGADQTKQPVPIRLFRGEATRVTLVGGIWAAQLLAFRALALGCQVVVMSVEPWAWNGFGERAVSRTDRVVVLQGEQPVSVVGTARQPVLVIHDLGTVGPSAPPPAGPWQTHLTVLRRLDEAGVPSIQSCELLIMQRLHPAEAAFAATGLQLDRDRTRWLQLLENDMVALLAGGADRYLWLHLTQTEGQHMGKPWR